MGKRKRRTDQDTHPPNCSTSGTLTVSSLLLRFDPSRVCIWKTRSSLLLLSCFLLASHLHLRWHRWLICCYVKILIQGYSNCFWDLKELKPVSKSVRRLAQVTLWFSWALRFQFLRTIYNTGNEGIDYYFFSISLGNQTTCL